MGRRSLEATKLLCNWMVRAAVDFFRGACPFLDEDVVCVADAEDELFFLFLVDVEELLLCDLAGADEELWACNPLACSSKKAARLVAVNRLKNIGDSVYLDSPWLSISDLVVSFGTFGGNLRPLPGRTHL